MLSIELRYVSSCFMFLLIKTKSQFENLFDYIYFKVPVTLFLFSASFVTHTDFIFLKFLKLLCFNLSSLIITLRVMKRTR